MRKTLTRIFATIAFGLVLIAGLGVLGSSASASDSAAATAVVADAPAANVAAGEAKTATVHDISIAKGIASIGERTG